MPKFRYPLDLQMFAEDQTDEDDNESDEEDKPEPKKKTKLEGDAPSWATQLQSSMNNLASALRQEAPPTNKKTQEIKVPPIKQPEDQQQQEQQLQEQQESQSSQGRKGKSLLRWLLG